MLWNHDMLKYMWGSHESAVNGFYYSMSHDWMGESGHHSFHESTCSIVLFLHTYISGALVKKGKKKKELPTIKLIVI